MKYLFITTIFLFLLQPTPTKAQQHIDQTSTWVYYRSVWQGPVTRTYYRTITIDGDSTIQGQTYFKRSIQGVDVVLASANPVATPVPKQFLDLVRDDANYFYTNINGQDSLVMDFTKSLGDSISIDGNCLDSISQIDSLYLGSTPLRRWTFQNYGIQRYIEGVGSITGYNLGNHCSMIGSLYGLVCYEKQGEQLILNPTINCQVYNSITNKRIESSEINIYPNPTFGQVQIDGLSSVEKTIEVLNANGKLVFVKESNEVNPSLNMANYPRGTYFLRIISEKGTLTKKLLKM
ncbi:MAG: Unknown protein [uncultured Aureispira sp.]|uniref:Secretion system C-terminal sorting domain-containing protein n=1 Tax=uncultured Aureispira sp. TaxID=1331704 RepID=A0A6S6UFN2_9BACT|nr:MAG: Unknown protein [uncultured Aureispira sp.]